MAATCPVCQKLQREDATQCEYCSAVLPGRAPLHLSTPMFDTDPHLSGIGGWLVLVAIGLIVGPLLLLRAIWTDIRALTGPNHEFIGIRLPGLPTLIVFELCASIALLTGLVILLVLFFRESRRFPRLYELWLGVSLAAKLAQYTISLYVSNQAAWEGAQQIVADLHSKVAIGAGQALVAAIVWIAYFETSQRVKATFVR